MLDKDPLRRLAPEEVDEALDELTLLPSDVLLDHHHGVFTQDRTPGVYDVCGQAPPSTIEYRLLLVGDQRVAEAVLELRARGARGRRLGHNVAPDAQ